MIELELQIGNFKKEIEAAKSYDMAAIKYYKEFAGLNFKREENGK